MKVRLLGRRDSWGVWDGHVHTALFKMHHEQGPAAELRELCSVLMGEGLGGQWTHVCAWLGPLGCSPETATALFIFCVKCESCSVVSDSLRPHTVHRILQTRILEWVAFPFSRGSSQPGIKPRSPTLKVGSLPTELSGKPQTAIPQCKIKSEKKKKKTKTWENALQCQFLVSPAVLAAPFSVVLPLQILPLSSHILPVGFCLCVLSLLIRTLAI